MLLTRRAVETDQLQKLRELFAAVQQDNRFYSAKLQRIDGSFDSLDTFARRVPFTTKQEVMEDQRLYPPFGSNLTYPLSRYTRFCQTSGTTHSPMRWLDTPESWAWMLDNWGRVYQAAGVTA